MIRTSANATTAASVVATTASTTPVTDPNSSPAARVNSVRGTGGIGDQHLQGDEQRGRPGPGRADGVLHRRRAHPVQAEPARHQERRHHRARRAPSAAASRRRHTSTVPTVTVPGRAPAFGVRRSAAASARRCGSSARIARPRCDSASFSCRRQLRRRARLAVRHEHRVVAEAARPAAAPGSAGRSTRRAPRPPRRPAPPARRRRRTPRRGGRRGRRRAGRAPAPGWRGRRRAGPTSAPTARRACR